MKDVKIVKDSLRIMNSTYVSSEEVDETSCDIRFTYKKRNYIIHINSNYKFMMIETTDSINGMNINNDTLELINYIRSMITFTEFEDYNVFAFSCRTESIDEGVHKILQVTKDIEIGDMVIDMEIADFTETIEQDGKIIPYDFGLNNFDKRIFEEDWLEDFNEKVSTLSEEDLFIMESTLAAYFYKLLNNLWEGEVIDPFITLYASSVLHEEIEKRLQDRKYNNWFNEWNRHFTEENIEKYLNDRNKEKNKELR